ncbi:hypothetical protein [Erythrobacter sp. HKB08]|uniref:hypothetical protein n=1 Tax=Erythrobacter sp. HKB08 TaxID=2502843 RepID=UPI001008DB4F|nr:hypothetical protein [Erythrobacter sp. HKB08]
MSGDRIEDAVSRIEAALARIAAVADSVPGDSSGNPELEAENERLRSVVSEQIASLDALIAEIGE